MIRAVCASHEGRLRDYNEDACTFLEDHGAAVAAVADGMGSPSGRRAADLAIEACTAVFDRRIADYAEAWWRAEHDPGVIAWSALAASDRAVVEAHVREVCASRVPTTPGDLAILEHEGELLAAIARRGLAEANRAIWARTSTDPDWRGLATTGVVAVFAHGTAGIAHVGEARAYRMRDGVLDQLTADHSLLNAWIAENRLTAEEIAAFPHKHVITRALGFEEHVEIDTQVVQTQPGDLFLLCSDGITNTFAEGVLVQALADLRCDAANHLVDESRRSPENNDNVTAVVVELIT